MRKKLFRGRAESRKDRAAQEPQLTGRDGTDKARFCPDHVPGVFNDASVWAGRDRH